MSVEIVPVPLRFDRLSAAIGGGLVPVTMEGGDPVYMGGITGIRLRLDTNHPDPVAFDAVLWTDVTRDEELCRTRFMFDVQGQELSALLPGGTFVPFFAQPHLEIVTAAGDGTGAAFQARPIGIDVAAHR